MRIGAYAVALGAALFASPATAKSVHVAVAGDQALVNYVNDVLAPRFEKAHPGVKVFALGTGPGDMGSQSIFHKLAAQKAAGVEKWDFDVVVIHQKVAGPMVQEGLLAAYKDKIPTGTLVSRDTARTALGVDVTGYVMPMFHTQAAIAYHPDLVKDTPTSYAELAEWVKKNPNKFGYSGMKRDTSGVGFVTGWLYAFAGDADKLTHGPYDAGIKASWDKPLADLKAFNSSVVVTPSDDSTLNQLSRGELAMGSVWANIFYTLQAQGKLPSGLKLMLPAPGMPGEPMYYAIPAKAANAALAEKFVALATSPEAQAEGIVKRFNWYPGIDARHLEGKLDAAVWQKLFSDISPQDLAAKGKPFPIGQYMNEIREAYRQKVEN
jgi:putative spermidine/putrescine transport system substrate-binding protein